MNARMSAGEAARIEYQCPHSYRVGERVYRNRDYTDVQMRLSLMLEEEGAQ